MNEDVIRGHTCNFQQKCRGGGGGGGISCIFHEETKKLTVSSVPQM